MGRTHFIQFLCDLIFFVFPLSGHFPHKWLPFHGSSQIWGLRVLVPYCFFLFCNLREIIPTPNISLSPSPVAAALLSVVECFLKKKKKLSVSKCLTNSNLHVIINSCYLFCVIFAHFLKSIFKRLSVR